MGVSDRIAHFRIKNGFTLKDVEKGTNIKFQTLSAYEHGRKIPNLENMNKIADYYGLTIDNFIDTFSFLNKEYSAFQIIGFFIKFLKFADATIEYNDKGIQINCSDKELIGMLKKIQINEFVTTGFVKNTVDNHRLNCILTEQMIFESADLATLFQKRQK